MSEAQRPGGFGHPAEPSQSRAIWALVLSIFGGCCCYIPAIVGTVMAFRVLRESEEDSADHGRGLAIGALGVAAFHIGGAALSVMLLFGGDLISLSSGHYADDPANADASVVPIWDLFVRDCFDDPSFSGGEGPLRQVACEGAHDAEVVRIVSLTATEFPGVQSFRVSARECRPAFDAYVGKPLRKSELAMTYYYPTRAAWADGDSRKITCVVWDPSGPMTDSAWKSER